MSQTKYTGTDLQVQVYSVSKLVKRFDKQAIKSSPTHPLFKKKPPKSMKGMMNGGARANGREQVNT